LFGGFGFRGKRCVPAYEGFGVEVRGGGDVGVVDEADFFHGFPVVVC
jgi:hypothetical protein